MLPGLAPAGAGPGTAALASGVAGCIAAAAFLSFSETCLTSLSHSRIHALLAAGGRRARVLNLWLERPHEVLTTILIGNCLATVIATALMTRLAISVWGEGAISYCAAIMTFLLLLFGEVTPKSLARVHAARAAVPTLHVLRVLYFVLIPPTWLLARASQVVIRALGSRAAPAGRDVTEQEIEAMIDLASREGTVPQAKADTLRAVFGLGERTVREVMVARTDLDALDVDLPVAEFITRVKESGHSRLPVYKGTVDAIVGVLHAKDLLHFLIVQGRPPDRRDLEALLREPLFVPETARLDRLLRRFRRGRQHLAVVVDEFGGTAGMATLEDVLEELVGEIWDEHDEQGEPVIARRGPGRWTADGRLPLSVLEQTLGLEFPDDAAFDTLGGLLMDVAGEVPRPGSVHDYGGYRFEVLSGDEKRVGLVRATKIEAASG